MPTNDNIKIFVSRRIDLDSTIIEGTPYIPVRCGAVYDFRDNQDILGDNTGDNISDKRLSYCELTVQYWAWKNVKADYYGLFHYRRYLNFSSKIYLADAYGNVLDGYIDESSIDKYGLDTDSVINAVHGYDVVLPKCQDVSTYPEKYSSVWDQYASAEHLNEKDLKIVLGIIERKYPEYLSAANAYLFGTKTYMCNLFIMKKELFFKYSEWLFSILHEFEREADMSTYTAEGKRTPGHLAERLLGIFVQYQKEKDPNLRIMELQTIVFLRSEGGKERVSASYNQQSCDESNWIIDFERVKPAYTGNNIPIVLSSSDLYAPYAATLIQSIIDNASDNNNYDILYVESGLSGENVRRVKSLCTKSNVSIRIIDISRYKRLPHVKSSGYFSVETYFRLLLPYIFSEYEKVIWLDSDTIVQTDVSKLFCINIGDNLVAATQDYNAVALLNGMDPSYKQFCVEELKMSNPYEYFQAGVLLMNLVEFRKQITVEEIVRLSEESSYPYADQDILNKLCYGRTYRLDNHWDVVADVENCLSNVLAYWEHGPIYESYQAEKLAPKIIHYAGPTKPWHSPANAFSDRFWDVCRKTPFYEVALVRMLSDISKGILRYGMEPFPQTESGYNPNEQSNSILRKGIRCLKENGIRYTLHKIVERICRR